MTFFHALATKASCRRASARQQGWQKLRLKLKRIFGYCSPHVPLQEVKPRTTIPWQHEFYSQKVFDKVKQRRSNDYLKQGFANFFLQAKHDATRTKLPFTKQPVLSSICSKLSYSMFLYKTIYEV